MNYSIIICICALVIGVLLVALQNVRRIALGSRHVVRDHDDCDAVAEVYELQKYGKTTR